MPSTSRNKVLCSLFLTAAACCAQQPAGTGQIRIEPIRGHMYLIAGAGGNIIASIGPDGVLLVDSGLAENADKVLDAISRLNREIANAGGLPTTTVVPPKPIRYIINTHLHADHTGGNEKISKAGRTITGGNVTGEFGDAAEGATIVAQQAVLDRMSQVKPALPFAALPEDTYHEDMKLSHFFNGEGVVLLHQPAAHTDGDTFVWFRGSDVIATGDVFVTTSYPFLDLANGGSIQGEIAALNRLLDLAVAEFRTEGGTLVIPGHGRIADIADVAYYRDMVTIIRDRIQYMIKKDMTLEQVKAAKPTADWDPRYGSGDRFVEAVYKSLTNPPAKGGK
ncbi:MAG: MBL fold metallo-hydrolase [Acidobacteriia bacterium]|nr:MBL fold metallo-hydrolase [Terriglobia bacterium]